ncbi:MAG: GGDEF domain-containing protein [Chloroherpetonaceae bacterium]|nr:GGDEF domain-containing protein [Chthonomonadaceae bacterium]MDW8207850.1 GGDEF domain-containing protein [Chloroherpetonaceae bacterium]
MQPQRLASLISLTPSREVPIPAAHAEPLERLLARFMPGCVTLLLRASHPGAAAWLGLHHIERHLSATLMEPARTEVWPLLADTWAIALHTPEGADWELSATSIHVLCHTLAQHLDMTWRTEAGMRPPAIALPAPDTLSPEDAASSQEPLAFSVVPVSLFQIGEALQGNIAELNALLEIILYKRLSTLFQPIVNLRTGQTLGYEALVRGPRGATLRRPGQMFAAASKAEMVAWFDIACMDQCFAQAARMGIQRGKPKLLFVNIDAGGLAYLHLHDRSLSMRAREYGINPTSVVIEITERQTLSDFPRLLQFVAHLREEGFRIAVDDAGAGYSSLSTIAQLRPDFVKIDHTLIRGMDSIGSHRALLEALTQYARHIGTALLAEGMETREEVATLIDLGVPYGQGYYLGKPAEDFQGVPREVREFIQQRAGQRARTEAGRTRSMGAMARPHPACAPDLPLAEAARRFARDASLSSVVVVDNGCALGLLMRDRLQNALDMASAAQMASIMPAQPIVQWMHTDALFVDAATPIEDAARQAIARPDISLQSDIIVVRDNNEYVGVVPTRLLFEAVTALQDGRNRHVNPLTGLADYVALEQELQERLTAQQPCAIVRADITRLEAFVRRFGVAAGDEMLRATGDMILRLSQQYDGASGFVAHPGMDDFVLLTAPAHMRALCRALIAGFDAQITRFFPEECVRAGRFPLEEGGRVRSVPICRLRVVAQSSEGRRWSRPRQALDAIEEALRSLRHGSGDM